MRRSFKFIFALFIISALSISFRYYLLPGISTPGSIFQVPIIYDWLEKLSKIAWIGNVSDSLTIGSALLGILLFIGEIFAAIIQRQPDNPFIILKNPSQVFPALGDINKISLDHQTIEIPYYRRENLGALTEQIYNRLFISNHLILLGESGVGKTREMGEVAKLLIQEGYTVILLRPYGDPILKKIETWPSGWPRTNLLFIIDDLHLLYKQKTSISPMPNEHTWSRLIPGRSIPFEQRFNDFFESVEKVVPDYKLIATVTSNTEEWSLINKSKSYLWGKIKEDVFVVPSLTFKDNENYITLLSNSVGAQVQNGSVTEIAAKEKFGSPRNIVRNVMLAVSHNRMLTPKNYIDTLQGSLDNILKEAEQRYPILTDLRGVIWHSTKYRFPLTRRFLVLLTSVVRNRWFFLETQPAEKAINHLINRQLIKPNGELLSVDDALLDASKDCLDSNSFSKAVLNISAFSFPTEHADFDGIENYLALIYTNIKTIFQVVGAMSKVLIIILRSALGKTKEKNANLYRSIKKKIPLLWKIQLAFGRVINILYLILYLLPRALYITISNSPTQAERYLVEITHINFNKALRRTRMVLDSTDFSKQEREYEEEKIAKAFADLERESKILQAELAMDDGLFDTAESILSKLLDLEYKSVFEKWRIYRNYAYALAFQGKWDLSYKTFQVCADMYGQNSPNTILAMIGKAFTSIHLGSSKDAVELLDMFKRKSKKLVVINWYDRMAIVSIDIALGNRKDAFERLRSMRFNFNFSAVMNAIPETKRIRRLLADELGRPEIVPGADIYLQIQRHWFWYAIDFITRTAPYIFLFLLVTVKPTRSGFDQTILEGFIVFMMVLRFPVDYRKVRSRFIDMKSTYLAIERDRIIMSLSENEKVKKSSIKFTDIIRVEEDFRRSPFLSIYSRNGDQINVYSRTIQRYNHIREKISNITSIEDIYPTLWEKTNWIYYISPIIFLIYPSFPTSLIGICGLGIGISVALLDRPRDDEARKIKNKNILYLFLLLAMLFLALFSTGQ